MGDELTLSIPKANQYMTGTGQYQFLNQPMLSQYLESDYSIFSPGYGIGMGAYPMMGGFMPGMGMGFFPGGMNSQYIDQYVKNAKALNNGQYDIMQNSYDRQTQLTFDQRGNQNVLSAAGIDLNESLVRLKTYIEDDNMRAACDLYKQLCDVYEASVGEEYDANGNRISNKLKSFKNQLVANYQQVNGTNLVADIEAHGSSEFSTMLSSWFNCKQPSAKEAISYMTGDAQQYGYWERLWRSWAGDSKADLEFSTDY